MSHAQQLDALERRRLLKAQHTGRVLVRPLSAHLDDISGLRGASDAEVLAWLSSRGLALPPPPPAPRCALLRPGETECRGGWHDLADGTARRCPIMACTTERRRLAGLLHGCGIPRSFDETKEDISQALLRRIDGKRNVQGLRRLLEVTREAMSAPTAANTALVGSCGTAKTQALLAIYFAALRQGVKAQWHNALDLHELALRITSFDKTERLRGHSTRHAWAAAELLVLDDLGDRRSDPRAPCSGLLLDVLAGGAAVAWSSNLNEAGLRAHDDIKDRAVSRLFGDRGDHPCRIVSLLGDDQRQHALRTHHRPLSGRERALGEERSVP